MTLEDKILSYDGDNAYILTLRKQLQENKPLNSTQKLLADKFIVSHAVQTEDKTLITLPDIKEFNINWDKYKQKPPFDFQKTGINWLLNKVKGILGDDMGLGKSLQAIIAALELDPKKVLIVCPATLKLNWCKELEVFTNNITVVNHKKPVFKQFNIINYDVIDKIKDILIKQKFDLLIGDEAHLVKNSKSRRTKAFNKIANKTKRTWLLTGTPIANKPMDFYNLLKICKHELGKRKHDFGMRYCDPQESFFGYSFNGGSNLKELHYKTQDVLFRRKKEEVLSLPPKIKIPIYLELQNRKGYNTAIEDYYQKKYNEYVELYDNEWKVDSSLEINQQLAELSVLRKFAAVEKIRDGSITDLINDVLDSKRKIVIFTNYRDVVDKLHEIYLDNSFIIDGRVSLEDRQKRIDIFQSGHGPEIMLVNLAVGSTGLTLTKATVALYNDLPWQPGVLLQSEDRIYRIGQEEKVDILYPVYDKTIDSIMLEVLREKIVNINEAVDDETGEVFSSKDIINEMYRKLKKLKNVA